MPRSARRNTCLPSRRGAVPATSPPPAMCGRRARYSITCSPGVPRSPAPVQEKSSTACPMRIPSRWSPRQKNSSTSSWRRCACTACRKIPAHRLPSAEFLADELGRWIASEPIQTEPLHREPAKRNRWWRAAALGAVGCGLAVAAFIAANQGDSPPAQEPDPTAPLAKPAAVTIYFEQVGPNVRVSALGTLDVQYEPLSGPNGYDSVIVGSDEIYDSAPEYVFLKGAGRPKATPLVAHRQRSADAGAFGFSGSQLRFDRSDISGGDAAAVTQITWSPEKDFFILPGRTLAEIGADNLQGTLAWTANGSGDTIRLQTGSPPPIP